MSKRHIEAKKSVVRGTFLFCYSMVGGVGLVEVGVVLFKIKDWFKSINFNIIFISETINEV